MTARPEIGSATDWDEVERTAACAGRAFPDESAEFFRRRTLNAPSLPLENTLMLRLDGEIASSLQIYERRLWLGGRLVTAGAIGNVLTLPEFRGEGHAGRLLDAAVEFMCEKGYALSLLIGDPGFYSRLGWEPLPDERHVVADPARVSGSGGRWVAFDPERDLDRLVGIRRAETGGIAGSLSRPAYLWRGWTLAHLVETDDVRLYEVDGEVRGYLVRGERDGAAICREIGWDGAAEDRSGFLAACWNALADGADRIRWDPPLPGFVDGAETTSLEATTGEAPMVRIHEAVAGADGEVPGSTAAFVEHLDGTDWHLSDLDKF